MESIISTLKVCLPCKESYELRAGWKLVGCENSSGTSWFHSMIRWVVALRQARYVTLLRLQCISACSYDCFIFETIASNCIRMRVDFFFFEKKIEILCSGDPLGGELSLIFVSRTRWVHSADDFTLTYRIIDEQRWQSFTFDTSNNIVHRRVFQWLLRKIVNSI